MRKAIPRLLVSAVALSVIASTALEGQRMAHPPEPFVSVVGLHTNSSGFLLVAASDSELESDRSSVWRISRDGGSWERVATFSDVWSSAGSQTAALIVRDSLPSLRSTDAGRTWTPIRLPFNRDATIHPLPDAWFAFTPDSAWRSDDDGKSWTLVAESEESDWSGFAPRSVAAGASGLYMIDEGVQGAKALLRSTDRGLSWTRMLSGLRSGAQVAVDGQRILVASDGQLAMSRDAGLTWTDMSPVDSVAGETRAMLVRGSTIVVVSDACRINESRDAGTTWRMTACRTAAIDDAFLVSSADAALLVTSSGVAMMRRTGAAWQRVPTGRPAQALAAVRAIGRDLYAVGNEGYVLHSGDDGRTWTERSGFFGERLPDLRDVAGSSAGFVAVGGEIFSDFTMIQSRDGRSWEPALSFSVLGASVVRGPSQTLVTTWPSGMLYRADGDSTWSQVQLPRDNVFLARAVWTGRSFLAWPGGDVYRSVDGRRWTREAQNWALGLTADLWSDDIGIVAVHGDGFVTSSVDDGRSWTLLRQVGRSAMGPDGLRIGRDVREGLQAVARSQDVIVAVGDSGILRSADHGRTWGYLPVNRRRLNDVWARGSVFVAVGEDGILRSEDAGVTWNPVPCCTER